MTTSNTFFDLLVVGGGINGAGIAADAAGRGLSVLLCEKGDLAVATSSSSSKLVHGGLRYLEYYEFGLVRKALAEREVLLAKAPHIIRPLRFVLPHVNDLRPAWLIRMGLFLYDHLARHPRLPNSYRINLRDHAAGEPLQGDISSGFVYSDCWVDDARLVVFNAMAAAAKGADIRTRTELVKAHRVGDLWQAQLIDHSTGGETIVTARALVNAAGPWVGSLLHDLLNFKGMKKARLVKARLVKGSHIVVPQLYEGDHAYILQHTDRRVIFVIPFEDKFSLIGTTDELLSGAPEEATVAEAEIEYLCEVVGNYFSAPVQPRDVVWSYTGVRSLFDDDADDPSAVTRDYVFDLNEEGGDAPLLSVFGGKITTYRQLADEALAALQPYFPAMGDPWTAGATLPGGDIPDENLAAYTDSLIAQYAKLDPVMLAGLARRHGMLAAAVLRGAQEPADLGSDLGAGLWTREVDYMIAHEWARTGEDVLWRRSKAGIHMNAQQRAVVDTYVAVAAEEYMALGNRRQA